MKIPKKLKVAGHTYRVKVVNKVWHDDERDFSGKAFHCAGRIEVATHYADGNHRAKKSVIEESFLHEVVHAVETKYCVGLEEKQVKAFSEGLYQVLKDNRLYFGKRKR